MCTQDPKEYPQLLNQFIPTTILNLKKENPNYDNVTKKTNPAFYGSGDWHSAVHSHWQVIRATRLFPNFPFVSDAIAVLDKHLTRENIEKELKHIPSFEAERCNLYGMAWVFLLAQELHEWNNEPLSSIWSERVSGWLNAIKPLESHARERIKNYIDDLTAPNRGGDYKQTALPLALARDWAQVTEDIELTNQIDRYSRKNYPINIKKQVEQQYGDFLSPSLAEADLLRRVLKPDEFTNWLEKSYFPNGTYPFVEPPKDFLSSHEYGLCISRAFMALGIAFASENPYHSDMIKVINENYAKGLPFALCPDIGVSHWVPTFIMYYVTRRGIFE